MPLQWVGQGPSQTMAREYTLAQVTEEPVRASNWYLGIGETHVGTAAPGRPAERSSVYRAYCCSGISDD
jgi:hypothetical protein